MFLTVFEENFIAFFVGRPCVFIALYDENNVFSLIAASTKNIRKWSRTNMKKAIKFEANKSNEKRSKKDELLRGATDMGLVTSIRATDLGVVSSSRARPTYARSYYIILI